MKKAQGIDFAPPHSPIFQSLLIFSEVLAHLFLKHFLSIYRIKRAHETPLLIVKSLNTYYKALDSRGGGFPYTSFGFSAASQKHHLLQCKGILKI